MKLPILATALVALATTIHAVPFIDPFANATANGGTAYTPGTALSGNTNAQKRVWYEVNTGSASTSTPMVGTNSLSFSDVVGYTGTLPASSGDSASFANVSARSARLTLAPVVANITSGSVYASYLLKITNTNSVTTSGTYFTGFNNTPGSQSSQPSVLGAKTFVRLFGNTFQLGTSKSGTTGVYESGGHFLNETVFIVVKYTFGSGVPSKMWINPDPATFGTASEPTTGNIVTSSDTADLTGTPAGIGTWVLMQRAAAQPGGLIDELRFSRTWAGVTGAPEIDIQPLSTTNNAGTTVTLTSTAVGVGTLTYKWQKNGSNISDGGNIAGTSTPNLTLSSVVQTNAGDYAVVVTGTFGTTTSATATVTVIDPAILTQPSSATLPPGQTAVFSVGAAGTAPLTYQWSRDGNALQDGGAISGATTTNLTITGITFDDVGSYTVSVTNSLGASVTSSNAVLTVLDPAITSNPQSLTNDYGTTASFSVTAAGSGPFTYMWQKNGVNMTGSGNASGITTSSLTLTNVSYLDAASYSVIVSNNVGNTATSASAVLTVREPIINSQPTSKTNIAGQDTSFTVGAIGSSLTYTWKKGTNVLTDGGNISGSTAATLSISGVSQANAGSYSVVVTSASGTNVTSSTVTLTVLDPPSITVPPVSRTMAVGANMGFAVVATGTAPITYQWRYNGNDISAATNASLGKTNVQFADVGTYSVAVMNSVGTNTVSATLNVVNGPIRLYPTNVVVLRVGDGVQTLGNTGNTLYLDQYTPGGAYLNTLMIPDSGSSSLLQAGNSSQEGYMSLSADRRFLTVVGYNVPRPYASSLPAAASTAAPRGIGTVNGLGRFDLAVSSTNAFSTDNIRCAVTDGTNNYWAVGSGRYMRYFGPAGQNIQIQNIVANTRVAGIFNNELYYSTASGTVYGIHKLGSYPTALATDTHVVATGVNTSFPADFALDPSGTVMYIAEDGGSGTNLMVPGVLKYSYDSGSSTWVYNYSVPVGAGLGTRQMTVDFTTTPATIYAVTCTASNTTAATANTLVMVQDNGASSVPVTIGSAGANQGYRGVRFGPVADAPTIAVQPTSVTNEVGTTAVFAAVVNGTDPRIYQWRKNGSNLPNGGNISGATTATLTIANIVTGDAGNYTLFVTNDLGSAISSAAVLTVTEPVVVPPPTIQTAAGASATNLTMTWEAVSGATYEVQYKTNLNDTVWSVLTNFVAGSTNASVSVAPNNGDPQRYFRVVSP